MSYRDVSESLRAYRDRIANDLEQARQAAKEAADRATQVKVLEKELAETEGLLAKMGRGQRGLPVLEDVRIAAPCTARWEEMVGDEHVRFCGQCDKNVYNLSSLPRVEAEALLAAKEGKMCVRLFRRADGTVLTTDCAVGVRRRRRRRAAFGAVGAGLMAAAAGLTVRHQTTAVVRAQDTEVLDRDTVTLGVTAVVLGDPQPVATTPVGRPMMGGIRAIPKEPPAAKRKGKAVTGLAQ
jgi:hypothetical protein